MAARAIYEGASRTMEAIRDVSFAFRQGEPVCIVGPSGAGKTTLLKCIAGLLTHSDGRIALEGQPVAGPPPARCSRHGLSLPARPIIMAAAQEGDTPW